MPLFMDYHKGLSLSVEDVKNAHMADEAVQSKYGVTHHQFWINEEDGTVFCLMEGPDKESCAAVHREAHGNITCSIVEVAAGFYRLLMDQNHLADHGNAKRSDGTPDAGIRSILVINTQYRAHIEKPTTHRPQKVSHPAKEFCLSCVLRFNGREINRIHDDSLIVVFDNTFEAVNCALNIQEGLSMRRRKAVNKWDIHFRMGLSADRPLAGSRDLFFGTVTEARRLCSIAHANEILVSSRIHELCDVGDLARGRAFVRILSAREQHFITSLFSIAEEKLSDEYFNVDSLSRNISISRPQLYRKVVSLTGKSPHDFIRDLRMDKAFMLLKQRAGNISEIALEVGYNNPSHFARCFQTRFGCTPSTLFV